MNHLLAVILLCCMTVSVSGADLRTLTVNGEGSAVVPADVAYIHLGVVTESETVTKAMESNKTATNNVFTALAKTEVAKKDVCVHSFTVSQKYKYVKDDESKLVGYVVRSDLKITVKNLDKVVGLLSSLTVDGHANSVSGVFFDVLDKTKVSDEAKTAAVKDAFRRAKLLADASGVKVGKVLTINEGVVQHSRNYPETSNRAGGGEQLYQASVVVVFQLTE